MFNRKRVSIVLSLIAVAGAFTFINIKPDNTKLTAITPLQTTTSTSQTADAIRPTVDNQAQSASGGATAVKAAPTQTQTQTQQTPLESQPAYGEDPSNPGVYIVFDKVSVMNDAGIPIEQQTDANNLIAMRMNWRYKLDSTPEANICYIAPKIKMASAGADYNDNPVTQLKWCNSYVQLRYGNWANADDYYSKNSYF